MDIITNIAEAILNNESDELALRGIHRFCANIRHELEMLYIEGTIEYDDYYEASSYINDIDDKYSDIIIER